MSSLTATAPAPRMPVSLKERISRNAIRFRVVSVFLSFAVLFFAFAMLVENFLTLQNVKVIAFNASLLIIVACGEAFVVITRNLDVSVGSIVGLAGYMIAKLAAAEVARGPELILIAIAIGALLGTINGLIVAYGQVPSIVATLGTLAVYRGITYVIGHGIEVPSGALPHWMIRWADATFLGVPFIVILAVLITLVLTYLMRKVRIFRRLYAVGSSPAAAVSYGLRPQRVVLLAYVMCGALCGLAGFLYASRVGTVTVNLGRDWELAALAAVVVGGVSTLGGSGNLIGVLFGAMILSTIDNGLIMARAPEFWRMFIQGCAIVGAIAVDALIERRMRLACAHKKTSGSS
jgi:rhamnose transport system permease protein